MIETIISGSAKQLWNNAKNVCKRKRLETRISAAEATDRTNGNTAAMDAIRAEAGGWQHARNEHPDDVVHCVDIVMEDLLPKNVLARVKRWLRRDCCKPVTMGIRTYFHAIAEINLEIIPFLPPYNVDPMTKALTSDEIIDIALFGTPKSWQKEMDRQGFDPVTKTPHELRVFMEQIEASEEFDSKLKADTSSNGKKPTKKSKNGASKNKKSSGGDKYCTKHGKCNHTTEECRSLKNGDSKPAYKTNGSYNKNKSWNKKADDSKKEASNELNALIAAQVNTAVQKQMASLKKRKPDNEAFALDSDALKDFNYANIDMSDLKIDTDDKISV